MKKWKLINSDPILSTKWLSVFRNKYQTPQQQLIKDYYTIKRDDFVMVVALINDKLLIGRQYRPATNQFYLSLPAGYKSPTEDPISCAKRELLEETGYSATHFKLIGKLDPLPGYLQSSAHIVTCQITGKTNGITDPEEFQELQQISFPQAIEMVKSGEINEMQAVSAILLAKEHLINRR